MNKNIPTQRDLMYLMNPHLIKKIEKKNVNNTIIENEDISFYQNRIKDLVDKLMKGKRINTVVDYSFQNFINKSIEYFKFIDKRDILQSEYNHIDNSLNPIIIKNKFTLNDKNTLFTKKKDNTKSMRSYVKIKNKKKKNIIKFPEKKNINLKVEELKNKDVDNFTFESIQKK